MSYKIKQNKIKQNKKEAYEIDLKKSKMSVFFLRHGEAYHNTDECKKLKEGPKVSPLTSLGIKQALSVHEKKPENITEIWASPSLRTMQTAFLAGLHPFHVKYELAEIDNSIMFICNGGDDESFKEYTDKNVILSYNDKVQLLNEKEHIQEIKERISLIKNSIEKWIENNPDGTLVIVGHLNIFKHISGIVVDKGQLVKYK
jgi:broad specificity phosphatase PhoE